MEQGAVREPEGRGSRHRPLNDAERDRIARELRRGNVIAAGLGLLVLAGVAFAVWAPPAIVPLASE